MIASRKTPPPSTVHKGSLNGLMKMKMMRITCNDLHTRHFRLNWTDFYDRFWSKTLELWGNIFWKNSVHSSSTVPELMAQHTQDVLMVHGALLFVGVSFHLSLTNMFEGWFTTDMPVFLLWLMKPLLASLNRHTSYLKCFDLTAVCHLVHFYPALKSHLQDNIPIKDSNCNKGPWYYY